VLELALAVLYLGEGSKKNVETALGSSDLFTLKFFVKALVDIYNLDIRTIKCELHLRFDQDSQELKQFWSKELNLPIENFRQVSFDKRTEGSKTYPHYKGVCSLRCGNVAIQRRLVYLGNLFFDKIANKDS